MFIKAGHAAIACALLAAAGSSQATEDGWHLADARRGCELSAGGPAHLIRSLEAAGASPRVTDNLDPVSGAVARVVIEDRVTGRVFVFFPSRAACRASLDAASARDAVRRRELEERYATGSPRGAPVLPSSRSEDRSTIERLGWPPLLEMEPAGIALLKDRIAECWVLERAMLGLGASAVRVALRFDRDGVLRQVQVLAPRNLDNRARAISRAAQRALTDPACHPGMTPGMAIGGGFSLALWFDHRGVVGP